MRLAGLKTLLASFAAVIALLAAIASQSSGGSAQAKPSDTDPGTTTPPTSSAPGVQCSGTAEPQRTRTDNKDAVYSTGHISCTGLDPNTVYFADGVLSIAGGGRGWNDPYSFVPGFSTIDVRSGPLHKVGTFDCSTYTSSGTFRITNPSTGQVVFSGGTFTPTSKQFCH